MNDKMEIIAGLPFDGGQRGLGVNPRKALTSVLSPWQTFKYMLTVINVLPNP